MCTAQLRGTSCRVPRSPQGACNPHLAEQTTRVLAVVDKHERGLFSCRSRSCGEILSRAPIGTSWNLVFPQGKRACGARGSYGEWKIDACNEPPALRESDGDAVLFCLINQQCAQVEPASGSIVVDGIDISSIGLHDLRSRIVSSISSLHRRCS